jgi:hypothetical protein
MAQKLTANRLIDGRILYWQGGGWTESFAAADQFDSEPAAAAALAAAGDFVARNVVVNPYLFETRDGRPVKEREIIRAAGPSVHFNSGKPADGPPPGAPRAPTSPQGGGEKDSDVSL